MLSNLICHLDMDGVLSDFDAQFKSISGGQSAEDYRSVHGRKGESELFLSKGVPFWHTMPILSGGKEVFETAVSHFQVVRILSSAGTGKDAERYKMVREGKILWLREHFPSIQPKNIIIVPFHTLKARHAGPDRILVDDHSDNILQWEKKDGIGILHDSRMFARTVGELINISSVDTGQPLKLKEIVDSL